MGSTGEGIVFVFLQLFSFNEFFCFRDYFVLRTLNKVYKLEDYIYFV